MIDGGHLRVLAKKAKLKYEPDFIESFAHSCLQEGEDLLRVLYYDCAPYSGTVKLPVSGGETEFKGSDHWLKELAAKDYFATRLGVLKFRGFKPKKTPIANKAMKDEDFSPDFEQKGVDMRIGLDIASYAATGTIDRIILVSGDTDCIPAMKHARISGLQVVLASPENRKVSAELASHADFVRYIKMAQGKP